MKGNFSSWFESDKDVSYLFKNFSWDVFFFKDICDFSNILFYQMNTFYGFLWYSKSTMILKKCICVTKYFLWYHCHIIHHELQILTCRAQTHFKNPFEAADVPAAIARHRCIIANWHTSSCALHASCERVQTRRKRCHRWAGVAYIVTDHRDN